MTRSTARFRLTPMTGLIAALIVILLSNVMVLARVAYNRSGEPETWVLSDRELRYPWRRSHENSGLVLQLAWQSAPPGTIERPAYAGTLRRLDVDPATLRALGFPAEHDCTPDARRRVRGLKRRAWIALEYDGPAHRRHMEILADQLAAKESQYRDDLTERRRDELERLRQRIERIKTTGTRLYAVDVAPARATLEKRHADGDRHLVLPATVSPWLVCDEPVRVRIVSLLTASVYVPKQHRKLLDARGPRRAAGGTGSKYYLKVAYGRLAEPWIVDVYERRPSD